MTCQASNLAQIDTAVSQHVQWDVSALWYHMDAKSPKKRQESWNGCYSHLCLAFLSHHLVCIFHRNEEH